MIEIAEIFRRYGPQYQAKFGERMPPSHRRPMRDIEQCRTEALGGHVYYCDQCEAAVYSYHSCKNRHCPKCQNEAAQHWLEEQQDLLLPVPYFLVTLTLPEGLRAVVRSNQQLGYDSLFRTSPASALHLARIATEISKDRLLLLKSSQVSRLRRTAIGGLSCFPRGEVHLNPTRSPRLQAPA